MRKIHRKLMRRCFRWWVRACKPEFAEWVKIISEEDNHQMALDMKRARELRRTHLSTPQETMAQVEAWIKEDREHRHGQSVQV